MANPVQLYPGVDYRKADQAAALGPPKIGGGAAQNEQNDLEDFCFKYPRKYLI